MFPLKTPGTLVMVEIDTDVPSAEIATTLLNISVLVKTVPNPTTSPSRRATDKEFWDIADVYLIIDPIFNPVKNFPGLNKVFPPVIVPPIIPFGNLNFLRKQFSVNCENPVEALCFTDLMSSSEYAVTVLIVLGKSNPLIISCYPTENVPEVCLKLIVDDADPAETANPLAPLLFPFTNDVAGNSALVIEVFKTRVV